MLEKILIAALSLAVLALCIKLYLMRRAAGEIGEGFAMKLREDTNTLIDISSRDREMRRLCARINQELRLLRRQRMRYQQGDLELKAAVTNISHDLRTPLTAIYGYLDMLEEEDKSPQAAKYLEVIRGRTELLRSLTEELFRYCVVLSDPGGLAAEEISLGSVLEMSLAAFYGELTRRGIEPQVNIPEQKVVRRLDRAALSRIFSNLLSNAVKYSDGDLEVSLTAEGRIIFANSSRALGQVDVEKLFDRFYTVEAARKSTGLGLSIARALAERMGGELNARYIQGKLVVTVSFICV